MCVEYVQYGGHVHAVVEMQTLLTTQSDVFSDIVDEYVRDRMTATTAGTGTTIKTGAHTADAAQGAIHC